MGTSRLLQNPTNNNVGNGGHGGFHQRQDDFPEDLNMVGSIHYSGFIHFFGIWLMDWRKRKTIAAPPAK